VYDTAKEVLNVENVYGHADTGDVLEKKIRFLKNT
jgi:hypothetical protein